MQRPGKIEQPPGVRIASEADRGSLADLILAGANRGHTLTRADPGSVRVAIDRAIDRDGLVFAVIGTANLIEGGIGLQPARLWLGGDDDWYWTDLGLYVREEYRKSSHGRRLLRWVQWWAQETGQPVYFSLLPADRMEAKERLFGRFGRRVGSVYLIGDHDG